MLEDNRGKIEESHRNESRTTIVGEECYHELEALQLL